MFKPDRLAVAVALVALLVAIYAVVSTPKTYEAPPTASATVRLVNSVTVDMPGAYTVDLGWILIKDASAVVELSANYSYVWFLLDGVRYGNPATATLQVGNHTVSAIIVMHDNGTKININYKVVG
jgi:glutamate/tyrosine decarboxylase-like PLP-dependent enzyme